MQKASPMLTDRSFAAIEESAESICLVCNSALDVASSTNIFWTSLPRNNELLASFVFRILRPVASNLQSSFICPRCNELFQMLEQAQWTVSNIRCEILKVYQSRESEKAPELKVDLPESQILPEELFLETEHKGVLERFAEIGEFRVVNVGETEDVARSDNFHESANNFCNLSIGIDNSDKKLEESIIIHENKVYGSKIDCHNIDNPSEVPKERETENTFENCSKIAEDREEKSELSNNSIRRSAKKLAKDDQKAQYTIQCRMCPRLFKFNRDLRSHSLKHGGSRPYYCRKCNERFSDLSLANIHATEMHSSKKNCIAVAAEPSDNEIADFTGEDWIILEETEDFEESESSDRKPDGAFCKPARSSKNSLKPLKYSCTTCGKKWRTSAELKTHVKSHSDLRPYMCEKCGQAYKHKHALEIHVGMHNGVSPYQCNVCNKCFTQKGALMRHLPMHTGEMPYQCELCGKRFVHHTSYNMHALSHTGKKSYQCHVCDLSLLSTSHLKRHMRVHTGEKPYSCELCGKSFAERYNLFAHQKIHDPVEIMAKAAKKITYKCEQCEESFDKKQKLDDHTKERHDVTSTGKKWNLVDIENPERTSGSFVDETWQDYNYSKLQSVVIKTAQTENSLPHISQDSIAILMAQTDYNKSPAVEVLQSNSTNSTNNVEIDQTQL